MCGSHSWWSLSRCDKQRPLGAGATNERTRSARERFRRLTLRSATVVVAARPPPPVFHGTLGRDRLLGCVVMVVVTGFKPSALAVSLISPASFVDCTMICARPLNTLRDQAGGDGLADDFHVHVRIQAAVAGFVEHAHGDDIVARMQNFFDVIRPAAPPSRAIRRRTGCSRKSSRDRQCR